MRGIHKAILPFTVIHLEDPIDIATPRVAFVRACRGSLMDGVRSHASRPWEDMDPPESAEARRRRSGWPHGAMDIGPAPRPGG